MTRSTLLLLLLLLPTVCLAGCTAPYHDPRILRPAIPGDFALQISVRGPEGSPFVSRQPAQYLVECNRDLRVALGAGATGQYFPRLTCVLTHVQYESLYRQMHEHALLYATTTPLAQLAANNPQANQVVYQIETIANGRVHDWRTTPEESPDVTHVLAMLARMSGRQPAPGETMPFTMPTTQETAP